MTYRQPPREATRRFPKILVAGLLVVTAAIAAAIGNQLLAASSSAASLSSTGSSLSKAASRIDVGRTEHHGALGEADGAVPDGTSVFDDEVPGVANLDAGLLGALRQAATDASGDGVRFVVNSGWRSAQYQEKLLREAVAKYGSEEEASRMVATPATSAHVTGDAVDIGPSEAAVWLSEHGSDYGLCQIYRNETWHYERRPEAIATGCPPTYANPTQDPRMQQ